MTFSYAVSDGIAAPVATTASLDITPVNDAPVTTPVTLAAIAEDSGRAADHAGRALGQRHGRRRTVADRDQPRDLFRQRHAGRQSQRHLELHAGGQRRHRGDVQLRRDRRLAAPVATSATLDITPVNETNLPPVTTPVTLVAIAEDSGRAADHPGRAAWPTPRTSTDRRSAPSTSRSLPAAARWSTTATAPGATRRRQQRHRGDVQLRGE